MALIVPTRSGTRDHVSEGRQTDNVASCIAFSAASVLLAATPGPDMTLSISRALAQGRNAALFVVVGFMVYSMKWSHHFIDGSLPFFNGISMVLGVYFTTSYPQLGPAAFLPITAAIWTTLMAAFGILLGVIADEMLRRWSVRNPH